MKTNYIPKAFNDRLQSLFACYVEIAPPILKANPEFDALLTEIFDVQREISFLPRSLKSERISGYTRVG